MVINKKIVSLRIDKCISYWFFNIQQYLAILSQIFWCCVVEKPHFCNFWLSVVYSTLRCCQNYNHIFVFSIMCCSKNYNFRSESFFILLSNLWPNFRIAFLSSMLCRLDLGFCSILIVIGDYMTFWSK